MQQAATRIEDSAGIVKGLQTKLDGHKSQLMSDGPATPRFRSTGSSPSSRRR